jgi:hypothetical protein
MAVCVRFLTETGGLVQAVTGEPLTCSSVLISGEEYAQLQSLLTAQSNPIDYAEAGTVFSFFFGVTLGAWFLAKNIGMVLHAIRKF